MFLSAKNYGAICERVCIVIEFKLKFNQVTTCFNFHERMKEHLLALFLVVESRVYER